jgi:hypothetical protein
VTTRVIASGNRYRSYGIRIALISSILLGLTLAALIFAPRVEDVTVIGQTPARNDVPRDSQLSITFSRAVNQNSAEHSVVIYPLVKGTFSWRGSQTLLFTPTEFMRPQTVYHITIRPGMRDMRGHSNRTETEVSFRTQ